MKKKITCFISSLASGGAEHQLAILANLLIERGYDVTFVTCLDDPDYYTLDSKVHRERIKSANNLFSFGLSCLTYFIFKDKSDYIISFRERMNLVVLTAKLFRRNMKVIAGERNLTLGIPSTVGKINQRYLYKYANYIVANSRSQEDYLKGLRKSWCNKVSSIINYTDTTEYTPSSEPSDDSIIKIGVFARFSPQKNCKRFIEMLSKVKKKVDKPFVVTWFGHRYGEVNEQYYRDFVNYIETYDVGDVLETHDPVVNVKEWMDSFHGLSIPSLFEGFSNSISEGICSGKPMLVSLVSDNGVMVKDGINGYTFDPTSIEQMTDAFVKFINLSRVDRIRMGAESRKIAESLFNKDNFVNDYIRLIES